MSRRLVFPALRLRRWTFFGLVCATSAGAAWLMMGILGSGGFTLLEAVILALFVPTFAWIVIPFWTMVAGFVLWATRRDPITLTSRSRIRSDAGGLPSSRTALAVPVYNEDPVEVTARLSAMAKSIEASGSAHLFDIHLLSDTRDPEIARLEGAAWARLQGAHPSIACFYRRRASNDGRKAGNLAEFVRRCGQDYAFMVVLDADSLMAGETLVRLVRLMEDNPRVGLVQTVPLPVRHATLFGRLLQFAGWLYTPLLAAGQSFWSGTTANYWGHNAIVRVAPFAEHACLPVLPGKPPMGGEILSHDFVEAALLRKAGWEVVLEPGLEGSWEEVPSNVVDYARRDRRWAQGSLQHLRLLFTPGLKPLNRLHFVLGAMGYLSSLLWLLMLIAATVYVVGPELGSGPILSLTPPAVSLLGVTAVVLFLPKALGIAVALVSKRHAFGGAPRLLAGAAVETLFSVLLAPVMMLYHARFVVEILSGRAVGWGAQRRSGSSLSWRASALASATPTVIGLVWGGLTLAVSPSFFLWMTPIFAGLVLSPLLVSATSRTEVGQVLRSLGLMVTPPELAPGRELRKVSEILAAERGATIRHARAWPAPVMGPDLATGAGVLLRSRFPADVVLPPRESMQNADRGLFDLRRGRPLLITDRVGQGGSSRQALVAAVEALDDAALRRLEALGGSDVRLVLTPHRAAAMGLSGGHGDLPSAPVALCPPAGMTADALLHLSAGHAEPSTAGKSILCRSFAAETAGLELARLGQVLPALVSVPVSEPPSSDLVESLTSGAILQVSVDEIAAFVDTSKTAVDRISEAPVPLSGAEDSHFILFRERCGLGDHVAVLIGDREDWPDPVPLRLHSACLTGDLFGSLRCDCGEQLRGSMSHFASKGGGVLLYLAQEGRGIGLGNKFRAYSLQETGLDTIDADGALGFGADERRYDIAAAILKELGIGRVELLTNNPEKVRALEAAGVKVVRRRSLYGRLNRHNLPYVRAKVRRAGHWLHDMLTQPVASD